MTLPMVNYVTFNRLGLTERSLSSVLATNDEFEMHIIDSNSMDDTWSYIESLNDSRIKSKTKFSLNLGPIFPANFNLTKRKPDQYFVNIDSDVYIYKDGWLNEFMKVFEAFPDVGLLGVPRSRPYPQYMPEVIKHESGEISYLELKNGFVGAILDFIPGHFAMLRPEAIEQIGYWSEENCYGDAELSLRMKHYTPFKVGFITSIEIDMNQSISCTECGAQKWCKLNKNIDNCFTIRSRNYKNESAVLKFQNKYFTCFNEMREGSRSAYCASIYDIQSQCRNLYKYDWVIENIKFFSQ